MNRVALLSALMLAATAAHADFAADFKTCSTITVDSERLACYDKLAQTPQSLSTVSASAPNPVASFGLETIAKTPEQKADKVNNPDVIAARLKGMFKGWKPDTRFALDNGQIWKNVGGDSVFLPDGGENPVVTVERGALGAYYLGVEGLNRKAKVKRVK